MGLVAQNQSSGFTSLSKAQVISGPSLHTTYYYEYLKKFYYLWTLFSMKNIKMLMQAASVKLQTTYHIHPHVL